MWGAPLRLRSAPHSGYLGWSRMGTDSTDTETKQLCGEGRMRGSELGQDDANVVAQGR